SEQQHHADQDHEAADQRAALGMHRRQQRAHRRRVADQLEERQHAERGERLAAAQSQHDRRRRESQEIDDAERREDIAEPIGKRGRLARRMARHRPQPRRIFQRERDHGEDRDRSEQGAEPRVELRHRGEHHHQHVEHDDGDDDADEARSGRIGQGIVLQQFIEAIPQIGIAKPTPARNEAHGPYAPIMAFSIAESAAAALAPSGPPACAMSGRPPPPLPPSASEATRTRLTALKREVRSGVTPTTTPALPSSVTPTMATTPDPSCFLPSSARLLRSFISMPSTARAINFTLPTSRTPEAAVPFAAPPPPMASFLRASDSSRSSFLRSSISAEIRTGTSSGVV